MNENIRRAVFPGSFDPFTLGHEDLVRRGLTFFDEIVVAIGKNADKRSFFSLDDRVRFIRAVFADEKRVSVATYEGLTVNFAREIGASHMLRGLRNTLDFDFEQTIAQANAKIGSVETVFLMTAPEFSAVNSSVVRDVLRHGGDVSAFVPAPILSLIK